MSEEELLRDPLDGGGADEDGEVEVLVGEVVDDGAEPVDGVEHLPAPVVARRVEGVEDAVVELGRVEVLADALGGYRGRLRGFVSGELPRGGKWPVAGVAPTVSMSDPKAKPTVDDEAVFAAWFGDVWPDEVVRRPTVTVVDEAALVEVLEGAADAGVVDGDDLGALLAAVEVGEEVVLPEKAVKIATKHTRETGDGRYVTTEEHDAGPGVIVDGVAVKPPGDPRLTIRWDDEWREAHASALLARLEQALPAGDEDGDGR